MKPSEHDLVTARIREEERQKLIDHYMQQAIANSATYGFLNVRGQEVPDPTVVEPPLGYIQQPDIFEQMRRMIRHEVSQAAAAAEFETFEEADDFEVDDEPVDYTSPWEEYFDPAPGEPAGPQADPNARPDPNAPTHVGGVQGGDPPAQDPPRAAEPPPARPA